MLRAALYRPATAEPSPADSAAAANVRNACQPEPGPRRTYPACETCRLQASCIARVIAGRSFARRACNQALHELRQQPRAASLPSRCLTWLRTHPHGASAAELSKHLQVGDAVKTSTALQRLCDRGQAYAITSPKGNRYYAKENP